MSDLYRVTIRVERICECGTHFSFLGGGGPRLEITDLILLVGKSAGHQLASPAVLPTKVGE